MQMNYNEIKKTKNNNNLIQKYFIVLKHTDKLYIYIYYYTNRKNINSSFTYLYK